GSLPIPLSERFLHFHTSTRLSRQSYQDQVMYDSNPALRGMRLGVVLIPTTDIYGVISTKQQETTHQTIGTLGL
ncbi:MAG: hypothetical protein KJ927_07005, partial [Candidatus Eisenbacteria bacterium]|nr:hypothetical protein [Candidatus Eisenbacteria bacterium]